MPHGVLIGSIWNITDDSVLHLLYHLNALAQCYPIGSNIMKLLFTLIGCIILGCGITGGVDPHDIIGSWIFVEVDDKPVNNKEFPDIITFDANKWYKRFSDEEGMWIEWVGLYTLYDSTLHLHKAGRTFVREDITGVWLDHFVEESIHEIQFEDDRINLTTLSEKGNIIGHLVMKRFHD